MDLPKELLKYSNKNIVAEEWNNIFSNTIAFLNDIFTSKVFTSEQFNTLEKYSDDLCKFENAIENINGLDDCFKEYVEAQTWLISALYNLYLKHDKLMLSDEMSSTSLEFLKDTIKELDNNKRILIQ